MSPTSLSSYDYPLPEHLIANAPVYPRESARLLVYHRATQTITHTSFAHLLSYIPSDTLIVLNNTKVLKARIYGTKRAQAHISHTRKHANTIHTPQAKSSQAKAFKEIFFHTFFTPANRAMLHNAHIIEELSMLADVIESSCIQSNTISKDNRIDETSERGDKLDSKAYRAMCESIPYALVIAQVRGKLRCGDVLDCGAYGAEIVAVLANGYRLVRFFHALNTPSHTTQPCAAHLSITQITNMQNDTSHALEPIYLTHQEVLAMLESIGHTPLPPYIKNSNTTANDYQSIFATKSGAIAAPTASLHISKQLLESMQAAFPIAYLTLHIGAGTFASVQTADITQHIMHTEALHITTPTLSQILESKKLISYSHQSPTLSKTPRSILCVGTSAMRSVEYVCRAYEKGEVSLDSTYHAQCDIFLHPNNPPRYVDYLLTNFHLPKSTLAMLVASLVGLEQWRRIYDEAIAQQYRFYSYGDGMLIL